MAKSFLKPKKQKIEDAVNRLMVAIRDITRGDIITYETMESAFGVERYAEGWSYLVVKFKRRLSKERNIGVKPIANVGYLMLDTKEERVYHGSRRLKNSSKQFFRAAKHLAAVPNSGLTVHEMKAKALTVNNLQHARRVNIRCLAQQTIAAKGTPTNPKRSCPAVDSAN